MIKRPISEQDQWIVDTNNAVTGIAPAGTGKETTLVSATTDAATGRSILWNGSQQILLVSSGVKLAEKTTLTSGAVQTAEQGIGTLTLPANSLVAGDVICIRASVGRSDTADAFGATTQWRVGTTGVATTDIGCGALNLSAILTGTARSTGIERWFRVVSVGTNSVIEALGTGNGGPSWTIQSSGGVLSVQYTLTGYNLATQVGYWQLSTTMGAATTTQPQTQYMRMDLMP